MVMDRIITTKSVGDTVHNDELTMDTGSLASQKRSYSAIYFSALRGQDTGGTTKKVSAPCDTNQT